MQINFRKNSQLGKYLVENLERILAILQKKYILLVLNTKVLVYVHLHFVMICFSYINFNRFFCQYFLLQFFVYFSISDMRKLNNDVR